MRNFDSMMKPGSSAAMRQEGDDRGPSLEGLSADATANSPDKESPSALGNTMRRTSKKKAMPPLLIYIETGDFRRAAERARSHPREVKTWASIPIKPTSKSTGGLDTMKRLPLHHACFKLRSASTSNGRQYASMTMESDPFIDVCRLILFLVQIYPDACGQRETRHGCLPLHLVAFASCARPSRNARDTDKIVAPVLSPSNSSFSSASLASALSSPPNETDARKSSTRPAPISYNQRSMSEATADTMRTTMSVAIAEEKFAGIQSEYQNEYNKPSTHASQSKQQSISIGNNLYISEKREEWAVKVINALLDAFPRAIRMSSEGGRLPLHWAAAGRSTPRVISTLITAYPGAAKHRTKDGSLPLHICAHWGISHSDVVVLMLKSYPDATYGKNRWERSPLEEALCMAGENGRPHQAALVRALRKHHSYWTRPEGVMFEEAHGRSRNGKHHLVDTDETVGSMDDSLDGGNPDVDEDALFRDERDGYWKPRGANAEGVEPLSPMTNDLPTLIRYQSWELAARRLELKPLEAKLNLRIPTRGGFTSTCDFTTLHHACENQPPKEIVEMLIRQYPGALVKKTMPGGKLPLHVACTWHAPRESIDALLAADRNACKVPDELGNLPIHLACFAGAPSVVVEHLLKAYPKAVLFRNKQGSLPEDITKRLKHDNRTSALALLHLCRDEVIAKRQMKHRRTQSDGNPTDFYRAGGLTQSPNNPMGYEVFEGGDIEVTYNGEDTSKKELMWI